jgi:hypothetical protein
VPGCERHVRWRQRRALIHEQFGNGIISAINFELDVKKVADPEATSAPSSSSTANTYPPGPSDGTDTHIKSTPR